MVISIGENRVIFINKFGTNFLNKNISFESLLVNIKEQVNSFFKSLKLETKFDYDYFNFVEGIVFNDFILELFSKENLNLTQFKRLGHFNSKEKCFDIYVRKLKFKETVLEIIIQDITVIKIAEKNSIETKYKQKILA